MHAYPYHETEFRGTSFSGSKITFIINVLEVALPLFQNKDPRIRLPRKQIRIPKGEA